MFNAKGAKYACFFLAFITSSWRSLRELLFKLFSTKIILNPRFDFISDPPESGDDFCFCPSELRRVIKTLMQLLSTTREIRAGFFRLIADGNDIIEIHISEFIDTFRSVE